MPPTTGDATAVDAIAQRPRNRLGLSDGQTNIHAHGNKPPGVDGGGLITAPQRPWQAAGRIAPNRPIRTMPHGADEHRRGPDRDGRRRRSWSVL